MHFFFNCACQNYQNSLSSPHNRLYSYMFECFQLNNISQVDKKVRSHSVFGNIVYNPI